MTLTAANREPEAVDAKMNRARIKAIVLNAASACRSAQRVSIFEMAYNMNVSRARRVSMAATK